MRSRWPVIHETGQAGSSWFIGTVVIVPQPMRRSDMKKISPFVVAAVAAAGIGTAAVAAEQSSAANSPAQQTADRDFGKYSKDGFTAFRDIRLARVAIFDGDTNAAKTDITDAANALDKAKNDDSIYMKAESELKAPAGATQPHTGSAEASNDKIQWLPIDGAMTLDENYVATPDKSASVAKANTQLKSGDQAHAMETLRLAGVNVSFDMEVAPLQKTLAGVDKAQQLADGGQWFEANQALKGVQDNIRFDVDDMSATPKAKGMHQASADDTSTQKAASDSK
jgi:hypothetical protein